MITQPTCAAVVLSRQRSGYIGASLATLGELRDRVVKVFGTSSGVDLAIWGFIIEGSDRVTAAREKAATGSEVEGEEDEQSS